MSVASIEAQGFTSVEPTRPLGVAQPEQYLPPERPELYELAQVTECTPLNPEEYGLPTKTKIHAVKVRDPYLAYMRAQDPEGIAAVEEWESAVDKYVADRRQRGKWQRIPKPGYEMDARWGDGATLDKIFEDHGSPALPAWRKGVPSAVALAPLCDPINEKSKDILNTEGVKIGEMDERSRLLFTALSDPRGIRSRGAVMAELINNHVLHQVYDLGRGPQEVRLASIASGTALPAMSAIKGIVKNELWDGQILKNVEVNLYDKDEHALDNTSKLATDLKFEFTENIRSKSVDLLDTKAMANIADELAQEGRKPNVVEIMGFFEYISSEIIGVDPAAFLKSCYNLVDDGGILIGGQMRLDRPNPDFTEGAVCWPYVVRRSIAEVQKIAEEAGVPPEQIEFFLPDDGVYMVFAIRKPEKDNQPMQLNRPAANSLGHLAAAA